jgi:alpha-methylacyl-CoA racemase
MGALQGCRIFELAGVGPGPMAGLMLADMGAEVIRVERSTQRPPEQKADISFRGKQSIALDLKQAAGANALLRLLDDADALVEAFRPGVVERLGIGPEAAACYWPAV